MARTPIYAAGGIVVRGAGKRRRVAVVQRSKDERWVLPRGKLKRDEDPVAGARREVVEETGHRVRVREFLGAITYRARGRPKVVQFWRMHAYERPSRDVMSDIIAVEWLPLSAAVRRLSYPLEKLLLQYTGRRLLKRRRRSGKKRKTRAQRKSKTSRALKARARKSRVGKQQGPSPRARAAKTRKSVRRGQARHHKPHSRAPLRIAAAKQRSATKVATLTRAVATSA